MGPKPAQSMFLIYAGNRMADFAQGKDTASISASNIKEARMDLKAVEQLIREIELADPIDWGMLNISEDDATRLIALSVVQHYEEHIRPMSEGDREYVFVSAIAKLTLENFVLNVKLAQAGKR